MKKIDTFSANSLKLLDKSLEEFENRYVYNLFLLKKEKRAQLGEKFHSLICAYINGADVSNIAKELDKKEFLIWENIKNLLKDKKENFIKTEYPFLIKETLKSSHYCLTGRFDAIYKDNDGYVIYDWKTLNIPKDPSKDLQSIVYLYALNKIYNTKNIKMRYVSLEKLEFVDVLFKDGDLYKKRIDEIISKYMVY